MKELIKEILRSYQIEIVSIKKVDSNLTEDKKDFIGGCHKNARARLTPQFKREVRSYLDLHNPFTGNFKSKNGKQIITYTFNIILTDHWFCRLFRKQDPKYTNDPKIENPNYRESIDLLTRNGDNLAKFIRSGRIKNKEEIEILTTDGSKFYLIVIFNEHGLYNEFDLILKTQIKGAYFYNKSYEKKIPLR